MSVLGERSSGPWELLARPRVYSLFQKNLAVRRARAKVADRYIRAREGDSVLDLGCGPAEILDCLPPVEYLGIDLNADYIADARRRFAEARPRARFVQMDVRTLREGAERFDLVLANGLLHHLDDEQTAALLETVGSLMKPGARLITLDVAKTPGQSLIARLLALTDRGRFVRSPEGYEALARRAFSHVEIHIRHDLMRVPYTHLFMECSDPHS